MGEALQGSGKCLCGAVTVHATLKSHQVSACHCGMCRTWNGGPAMVVMAEDVRVNDESALGVYQSSPWLERVFCKHCGTHLLTRTLDGSFYGISAGILEHQEALTLARQIFIDKKPKWYAFSETTQNLTEADYLKQFS